MARDSFYTPKILAERLISFIKDRKINCVADFCIGDGELLRAARNKWPKVKCFGSDISDEAVENTQNKHYDWVLSKTDFLDQEQRNESIIFQKNQYDLILLNPPFSCKGGKVNEIVFEDRIYYVSTAMEFLITSISYMKTNGVIYAIMPSSVAYSQKDKEAWEMLERKYNLCLLDEPKVKYFRDCTPNVILISLNDLNQNSIQKTIPRIELEFNGVSVLRGKLSMNLIKEDVNGFFLVHSTNLNANSIINLNVKVVNEYSKISGPAILIPRVGKPISSKICIIYPNDIYILSDCVIGIKTSTIKDAERLYLYMLENWRMIETLYTGTGAKYITIDKLKQFLNLDYQNISFGKKEAI
ncbi:MULTISPECIES: methyltransferase [Sphingobacterium]|uniref:methyltransferase n=1 Tax=Sphingobacterium TaxID=28453 RepID=UPI00257B7361|nr:MULTISPECIES: methyltransferase [Sphingobacterium]